MPTALLSYVNGQPGDEISLADRSFQFGDGVFETLRYHKGGLPLFGHHYSRLLLGCERLLIPLCETTLNAHLQQMLNALHHAGLDDAIVKLQISRGNTSRGYGVTPETQSNYIVRAFESAPFSGLSAALQMSISPVRLAAQPLLAGIKHTNRLEQVLARQLLGESSDDAFLLGQNAELIEAISSNVFIRESGKWLTPSLQLSGVEGVTRSVILERLGSDASVQTISLERLFAAQEVFICNSVAGISPVQSIDPGPQWPLHQRREWKSHRRAEELAAEFQRYFVAASE